MILKRLLQTKSYIAFNMMPIIDIILLLIIFFIFTVRYIAAENFTIEVPEDVPNALSDEDAGSNFITLSVWYDDFERMRFCAVGADVVDITEGINTGRLVELINSYAENIEGNAVVNLRMQKSMEFAQYSGIIQAISLSNATDISIAAFEQEQKQ